MATDGVAEPIPKSGFQLDGTATDDGNLVGDGIKPSSLIEDASVAVVRGPAIVNRHDLVFAGSPSGAEIAAAHAALLDVGILVR